MKKFWMVMTLAAASLAGTLQAASTLDHQTTIDFGFRVDNRSMPAGRYEVLWDQGHRFTFRHVDTGRSAYFFAPAVGDSRSQQPMITFTCYSESCSVAGMIPASGGQMFRSLPKSGSSAKPAAMVNVMLRR